MAKKHVFRNPVPEGGGGGGTVLFVTKQNQEYSHVKHKIFPVTKTNCSSVK